MGRPLAWTRVAIGGALLLTVLMVGQCSATGLITARGSGAELILRDPGVYLSTVAVLVGPLLLVQAVTFGLTLGRMTRRRAGLLLVAIFVAGVGSLVTAYAGFVASLARLCVGGAPTPAQDAACAAGTGALAACFGISVLIAVPFAFAMRRDSR